MKLPNGTGTVVKMSGKRRRPYAAVITEKWILYYNDDGSPGKSKQKRKYIGYYKTRKEALKALMSYDKTNDNESAIAQPSLPSNAVLKEEKSYVPTFSQLWDEVQKIKNDRWGKSIHKAYRLQYRYVSDLYDKRVDEITYPTLQKEMNKRMKDGHSANSLRLFKTFLTMTFGEAVKIGYIQSNPATYLEYKETKDKIKKHAISKETIKKIVSSNAKSKDVCLILLYTGMRINELLSLKKASIDGKFIVAGSKTEAGKNRRIPIHPFIESYLKHYLESKGSRARSTVTDQITKDCQNVYGDHFTPHELRHTFITLMTEYHADTVAIKRIVGHAGTGVTEKVYTHLDDEYLYSEILKLPFPDNL